jgi:hypothetical protein
MNRITLIFDSVEVERMTPRTESAVENLRQGIKKMDESLSPLARALRKFNAGRPTKQPVDTPLGAVVLAVEQRDRLARLLKDEGVEAHLFTQIVTRHSIPGSSAMLTEDTAVIEGTTHTAVKELELHVQNGNRFTVLGLVFAIETDSRADVVTYTLERTPEGQATLLTKTNEFRLHRRKGQTK